MRTTASAVSSVVVKLPPSAARTQTVTVAVGTNATTYTNVAGPIQLSFNPATGKTATITFPSVQARYVRITFTTNQARPEPGPPRSRCSD